MAAVVQDKWNNPQKYLKLPQGAFSGPSKDDIVNALSLFFGSPSNPEKLADYTQAHAATYSFPDAYAGQSTTLRDTMVNLIIQSPQDWHTGTMLPFTQIEGTTVEWDELRFDVRLMQRVPYEGVSRMQTSIKRRHRDRIVRRGLGMMIESDFYATPAGQKHFQQQLLSIRYCVQETCNFDVLFALLTCGNYDFRYDINRGLRPARSLKVAMQHEVLMYAGAQKEGLNLERIIEEVKMRMARYQVQPNTLIVPPQLSYYMSMASDRGSYKEQGTQGQAIFNAGVAGFEGNFRGLNVFRSMPFETTDETDAVQMLQRQTQVGEFYYVGAPDSPPYDTDNKTIFDTVIFDEDKDQLSKVTADDTLTQLLKMLGAEGGDAARENLLLMMLGLLPYDKAKLNTVIGGSLTGQTSSFLRLETADPFHYEQNVNVYQSNYTKIVAQARVTPVGGVARMTVRGAAKDDTDIWNPERDGKLMDETGALKAPIGPHFVEQPMTIALLKMHIAKGVWCPLRMMVMRPFIEHLTLSAIAAVAGADTGATLFGPSDMQLSANTSVKTIEGHYTMHSKAVVTKPQNVFVLRDIMMNGYIGGCGTKWFSPNSSNFMSELNKRLGLDEHYMTDTAGIASMMALPCSFSMPMHEVIGVSDRILPWTVARNAEQQYSHFPGGKVAWLVFYNLGFDFTAVHYGEDQRAIQGQEFLSNGSLNNSMLFQGPHRRWNSLGMDGFQLVPGQGHFGTDALPGDARWRRGQAISMKSTREEMLKGEMYSKPNFPIVTGGT